jgi:AraC-like DNA-binding protein
MPVESSSLPLMDDALLRVNVSRTRSEIAIACVRSDRRYGPELFAPVILAVDGSRRAGGASASTAPRCGEAAYRQPLCAALSVLLFKALAHGYTGHDAFVRHMTLALYVICRRSVDGESPLPSSVPGGLKPWQKALAEQRLDEHAASANVLPDVARSCGLSTSHFSRAFAKSFGLPPYRWILIRRLEKARALLRDRSRTLVDIAYECGFCDQSHMSHAFSRRFGVSPGAWRRGYRPDDNAPPRTAGTH